MKSKFLFIAASLFFAAIIWTACSKDNSSQPNSSSTTDVTTQATTQASDQSLVTAEVDNVTNDINSSVEAIPSLSGSNSVSEEYRSSASTNAVIAVDSTSGTTVVLPSFCSETITYDTSSGNKNVTITYNGGSCNGKTIKSGSITYSTPYGVKWKTAGAYLTVTYNNYKVLRVVDNKSVTLNGTETYTNVSGGLLVKLPTLQTITRTIKSNGLIAVFADSTGKSQQTTWQIAKQRVFTYNNGIVVSTTGIDTANGVSGISEWGTNRYGNNFTTVIAQPIVEAQSCDFRITGGQVEQILPKVTVTTTYGLDSTGNATSCPGTGYYYMKIIWQYATKSYTVIKPY